MVASHGEEKMPHGLTCLLPRPLPFYYLLSCNHALLSPHSISSHLNPSLVASPSLTKAKGQEKHVPGNLMALTSFPASTNLVCSSFTCVVLPLRSRPSSTMKAPLAGAGVEPSPAAAAAAASGMSLTEEDMPFRLEVEQSWLILILIFFSPVRDPCVMACRVHSVCQVLAAQSRHVQFWKSRRVIRYVMKDATTGDPPYPFNSYSGN